MWHSSSSIIIIIIIIIIVIVIMDYGCCDYYCEGCWLEAGGLNRDRNGC